MRIKKGFTLAEILIVLMVIGVIATMTVPSLMKGVNEATYKTAFKKAYNAVTNIAAVEKISGQLPVKADTTGAVNFFASLNSNLSVKEYWANPGTGLSAQSVETEGTTHTIAKFGTSTFDLKGTETEAATGLAVTSVTAGSFSPWLVTEDGLAYAVTFPANSTCGDNGTNGTKARINTVSTKENVLSEVCVVVMVDVNGVRKGPNILDPQVTNNLTKGVKMDQLYGDRYYIYVGTDGVATGAKDFTVSGRLLNDMK